MKTLNELIKFKMSLLEMDEKVATYNSYRTLLAYIDKHYGDIEMKSVNADFCRKMQIEMKSEGKSDSTIRTYFALITAIFNYAAYKKYVDQSQFPFQRKSYELDLVKRPKMKKRTDHFLTKEQMTAIYNNWCTTHNYYIGLFLMSYLCNGCNVRDLIELKWNKNKDIITFQRHKTKEKTDMVITIPIIDKLRAILDKCATEYSINDPVLYEVGKDATEEEKHKKTMCINNLITRELRKLDLDLPDNISTTFARHSYANVMSRSRVPFQYIEQQMGHSLKGVSTHYISSFPIEDMFEFNGMLFDEKPLV